MEEERSLYPTILIGDSMEVAKIKRDAPPAHYEMKIESLSQLADLLTRIGYHKYESHEFEADGYKWKLSLYPRGDLERNGSNHISLYLVLSETNNLPIGSEVNAFFKLFVYDQIHGQYLTVQDVRKKPMCFRMTNTKYGFSRFLPLATFNDASNGYLIDDCCVFGAEVFVTNCTGQGEVVSIKNLAKSNNMFSKLSKIIYKSSGYKHDKILPDNFLPPKLIMKALKGRRDARPTHYTFKIESFSKLLKFITKTGSKKYESREFEVSGYKWKLSLYPDGDSKSDGRDHISLYLVLSETNNLPIGGEVNAFFKLFVYDQIQGQYLTVQDVSEKPTHFYVVKTECGFPQFLPLSTFKDASNGFLVNDCCIFGAEIFVTNYTGKGQRVYVKNTRRQFPFTMYEFSKHNKYHYTSSWVNIEGYDWCISVYPSGISEFKDKYMSAYLHINLKSNNSPDQTICALVKLRLKNRAIGGIDYEREYYCCFNASVLIKSIPQFILLSDLKESSMGYIWNDTVIVEVEIHRVLLVKDFV